MSRTGRPKADNPRLIQVGYKIDEPLYDRLSSYAKSVNKTKSTVSYEALKAFLENEEKKQKAGSGNYLLSGNPPQNIPSYLMFY